jgi:outer membrane protein
MRSYRIFLIVLFAFFYASSNAQFFVGGKIGFTAASHKTDNGTTTLKSTANSFSFYPSAGKFLSDKLAVGLDLEVTFSGSTSANGIETKSKSSTIGASPYLRYYAIKWNKFSVYGQANLGFSFSNSSETTDGTKTQGPKITSLYCTVYPGLAYDLSDKLQLQTSINIFRLGFGYTRNDDGTTVGTTSYVIMGAGMDDIISIPTLSIGAIYKF